jgi:hypothetical protein
MGLWVMFTDAIDEDIAKACLVAQVYFTERDIDPGVAQEATHEAADLADDFEGDFTPNSDLVVAWWSAERLVFDELERLTGEWPAGASLIHTED